MFVSLFTLVFAHTYLLSEIVSTWLFFKAINGTKDKISAGMIDRNGCIYLRARCGGIPIYSFSCNVLTLPCTL